MSQSSKVEALNGLATVTNAAAKYLPEPATRGIGVFNDVMNVVRSASSVAVDAVGGVPLDATGSFAELIQKQIEVQTEFQTTAMVSNIEKAKHETKMQPVRNVRVS